MLTGCNVSREANSPRLHTFTATEPTAAGRSESISIGGRLLGRVDVQANAFTGSRQDSVAIAPMRNGDVIAVWQSRRQEEGTYGIFARRIDRHGRKLGPETHINTYTADAQMQPAAAVDGAGGVWVAWESFGQDGDGRGAVLRRFDEKLDALTPEILVSEESAGHQRSVSVAGLPDGGVSVVWVSQGHDDGLSRVFSRRFGIEGQPTGESVRVDQSDSFRDGQPVIRSDAGGRTVVVWQRWGDPFLPSGIMARRFDAEGSFLGDEFAVCDVEDRAHVEPSLAVAVDGRFVVAWATAADEDYVISMRRFNANGRPASDIERVDQGEFGGTTGLSVAMTRGGAFVVAWSRQAERETDLYARAFDSDGEQLSDIFRVTASAEGDQQITIAGGGQRMACDESGRIVVGWSGNADAGDSSAAVVTIISADPLPTIAHRYDAGVEDVPAAAPHQPPTFSAKEQPIDRAAIAEAEAGKADADGFLGIVDTGWNPPDPHLAVGMNHIVQVTNGEIAFFTKDGVMTFSDNLEGAVGFWGPLGATTFLFDPEVIYDSFDDRFIAIANERATNGIPYLLLAVSDDGDPNGLWHKYRFDMSALGNNTIDSPNVSVDATAVYIGVDFLSNFNHVVLIVEKAAVLVGDTPVLNNVTVPSVRAMGMVVNASLPPAQYMMESTLNLSSTNVRMYAITDPFGAATVETYDVFVSLYDQPENPPSLGTTTRVDTFDSRFWSCMYRDGFVWATHHIGAGFARQRWYQIDMNGWPEGEGTPLVVQSGTISPGDGARTYYGSIWADEFQNAVMYFSRSSPTEFISMSRTYRLADDPLGQMRTPEFVKVSTDPLSITGSDRWGDYSMVVTDPAVAGLFWGVGEYLDSEWRTWVNPFPVVDLTPPSIASVSPFDGYIDPRLESTNGLDFNLGISQLTITFDEPVRNVGGGLLDASAFTVTADAGVVPQVAIANSVGNPVVEVFLEDVIPVQANTAITMDIEDENGNATTLEIRYGFLPADVDQDGVVGPFDLLRFRQIVNGVFTPTEGESELFADVDRDGAIGPFDLLVLRQLINGVGNATQPWAGEALP